MNLVKLLMGALFTLGLTVPLMAGSATSEALVAKAQKEVASITPQALKKMIDNEEDLWMLDIREPYMRIEGSIDGMDNAAVGRGTLEFDIEHEIEDKNAFIVVYCRSGKGAPMAAQTMRDKMGYKNVRYLVGGMDSWLEAGYSIFNHFGELQLVKE